jgi:hypothetical protein
VQIEYGDHNPNRHTAGFLNNVMQVMAIALSLT